MKITTQKLLLVTAISLALSACGDDGDNGIDGIDGAQGAVGEQGATGEQGPAGQDLTAPEASDITIEFGGRLAQDFADATSASTNAFELVAGTPSEFEEDDDDVAPGPPSVGADIPVTYFGPAPSDSNPRLIGPVQL